LWDPTLPQFVLEFRDETSWAMLPVPLRQASVDKGWQRTTPNELVEILESAGAIKTESEWMNSSRRRMRILIVEVDDALRSVLARELEQRGFEAVQTHFGDGGLHLYEKNGPWEFVLTDFRFIPSTTIKNGAQLLSAIHGINPFQQMAMMTADTKEARRKLPEALRHLPVLRKPFRMEQLLPLLRQPMLPL
jgi:CheY-like chemotaxis protein